MSSCDTPQYFFHGAYLLCFGPILSYGANFCKGVTQIVGKDSGDSQTQVRRFIRLTNLIPELLDMVDNSVPGWAFPPA